MSIVIEIRGAFQLGSEVVTDRSDIKILDYRRTVHVSTVLKRDICVRENLRDQTLQDNQGARLICIDKIQGGVM